MAEREIDGRLYRCDKVKGEQGVDLFFRVSTALSGARGLFEAIAADSENPELVRAFFEFAREMNREELLPLTMELAAMPVAVEGPVKVQDLYLEEIVKLAFFTVGVNFSTFLPVGLDEAILGPAPAPAQ